jgi:hypothetical protein
MSNSSLPLTHKCAVHGMVAAYLNLASQLLCEQPVCQYISEVFIEYLNVTLNKIQSCINKTLYSSANVGNLC